MRNREASLLNRDGNPSNFLQSIEKTFPQILPLIQGLVAIPGIKGVRFRQNTEIKIPISNVFSQVEDIPTNTVVSFDFQPGMQIYNSRDRSYIFHSHPAKIDPYPFRIYISRGRNARYGKENKTKKHCSCNSKCIIGFLLFYV